MIFLHLAAIIILILLILSFLFFSRQVKGDFGPAESRVSRGFTFAGISLLVLVCCSILFVPLVWLTYYLVHFIFDKFT
jgi:hypothetical protein